MVGMQKTTHIPVRKERKEKIELSFSHPNERSEDVEIVDITISPDIYAMVMMISQLHHTTSTYCAEIALRYPKKWEAMIESALKIYAMEKEGELKCELCDAAYNLAQEHAKHGIDQSSDEFVPIPDPIGIINDLTEGKLRDPLIELLGKRKKTHKIRPHRQVSADIHTSNNDEIEEEKYAE